MVPKPRASEGRERGAEPRAPNRTSAGMGCGDRKYAPGLCPLLLPPPACASRATLSRKPCPGGHHQGAAEDTRIRLRGRGWRPQRAHVGCPCHLQPRARVGNTLGPEIILEKLAVRDAAEEGAASP